MKHLFVPYPIAVMAKDAGFDEDTFGWYQTNDNKTVLRIEKFKFNTKSTYDLQPVAFKNLLAAPLYQQIIDWFRERHKLHIYIETTPIFDKMQGSKYKTSIKVVFQPFRWTTGHYYLGDTYYEALNKVIEQAFELLKTYK